MTARHRASSVETAHIDAIAPAAVQLLHDRPELRDSFPLADQVDMAVRAGA